MRVRRRVVVVVALLLLAGGIAAFLVPSRQSGRGAVPARDDDARRILRDVAAWDAATHDERRAAAAWVAARTDGFAFDGTETFGFDGHRHEIAVFAHAATGLEFSLIPGGTFLMGSPEGEAKRSGLDQGPQHSVTIPEAFLLCRTETTQAAWQRVMGKNPSKGTIGADHPVEGVSWDDAQEFCARTGLRLPSEAEWEYACRAGTTTRWWSGDDDADLERVAWFDADPDGHKRIVNRVLSWLGRQHPSTGHFAVARKDANPFGLHDVHGNVWEWCQDEPNGANHATSTADSAQVDSAASNHVVRSGSWFFTAWLAPSGVRDWLVPSSRYDNLGFRPAKSVAR